jgi:hypothetical protein
MKYSVFRVTREIFYHVPSLQFPAGSVGYINRHFLCSFVLNQVIDVCGNGLEFFLKGMSKMILKC